MHKKCYKLVVSFPAAPQKTLKTLIVKGCRFDKNAIEKRYRKYCVIIYLFFTRGKFKTR